MKIFTRLFLSFTVLALVIPLTAQEEGDNKLVIVRKITQEDGSTVVVKKRMQSKKEVIEYFKELKEAEEQEIELHTLTSEGENVKIDKSDGETILLFRRAAKEAAEDGEKNQLDRLHIILHDEGEDGEQRVFHHQSIRADRPLLGVYLDDHSEGTGLAISGIVPETGAYDAGLRSGDRILRIDGQTITSTPGLRKALSKYEAGETIQVDFLRDGSPGVAAVTLTDRQREWSYRHEERDPCKVFIGVYLNNGSSPGRGVDVSGIINDTPAEVAGLQKGDLITAIDGIPVNSYGEVLRERNKHQPGDWFTLAYMRGDSQVEIEAQFQSCEEEALNEEVQEPVPTQTVTEPSTPVPSQLEIDRSLELINYSAFPNPTFGRVNLQFQGPTTPTVIQVTTPDGKVVYEETLNQFDGFYNKELNLGKETPGIYFLSIRQGDNRLTEKIVLMPKA